MPMPTTISVLIPTRNRGKELEASLLSILRQEIDDTISDWEVIVIDNGSTDHTASVLRGLRDAGPLKILHEPVAGKSRSLNRALNESKGEFLAFTDDDVYPSSAWLRELVRGGRTYTDAAVICGPISPTFPDGAPSWLTNHPRFGPVCYSRFEPDLPEGVLLLRLRFPSVPIFACVHQPSDLSGSGWTWAHPRTETSCVKTLNSFADSGGVRKDLYFCQPPR